MRRSSNTKRDNTNTLSLTELRSAAGGLSLTRAATRTKALEWYGRLTFDGTDAAEDSGLSVFPERDN